MTKAVEEARRAAFEAACPVPYYITWNVDRAGYYSIHRDSTRKRGAECYDAKWQGFNAGLDAVEIQLPSLAEGFADHVNEHAQTVFLDAIEQTGLGLRVK